jgi:DNA-binding LacI/PurR family transcriptional regulator
MRDVAEIAGVSHQTVSRVLNGHPNIKESTRQHVLSVIDSVNYRRNSTARALARGESKRFGVLVDSPVQYGPNSILRAVEEAAHEAGYSVSSLVIDDVVMTAADAVRTLLDQGVDALCVIVPRSTSIDIVRDLAQGVPTVLVIDDPGAQHRAVSVDQGRGAQLAVEHLIRLGHRSIAHVAGPLDWVDARAREKAWRQTLEAHGLDAPPLILGDWTADFGYEFARAQAGQFAPTAIFAANDQMALGLIHGFSATGVRVPQDVSIVGFDDHVESKHYLPPLTTVRQDFTLLGSTSVRLLLDAIAGHDETTRTVIEPELIVRDSTAPPPV